MLATDPLAALETLIESVRVGLLSTVSQEGYPRTRWMTATLLPGVRGYVYCVSAAGTAKVSDMLLSDKVAWSFQSASLDRVVSLTGRAAVIDSPELKARVLESLGKNLVRFWRLCPDPKKLVVIETAIEHASLYYPADNAAFEAEDLL